MSRVQIAVCIECGWPFRVGRNALGKFCSHRCQGIWRSKNLPNFLMRAEKTRENSIQGKLTTPKTGHKVEFTCAQCGVSFWALRCHRPKPRKFCTRSCWNQWRKEHKELRNE